MTVQDNDSQIKTVADLIRGLEPGRVVFLLGAGASIASEVPLARTLRGFLMRGYEDLMQSMLYEKIGSGDVDNISLEMAVSLYDELHHKKAGYDFLKSQCPDVEKAYLYPIPYAYEAIAHMFYFDITRHVISLNFDELLERALDDEVGPSGYQRIQSRSSFERLSEVNFSKDKRRFLFKPHGTITYRMTMRHSWEDVMRLEDEKKKVLENVIANAAVLITVGYGFLDRDLRGVILSPFLNPTLNRGKKLIVVTYNDPDIDEKYYLGNHKPIKTLLDDAELKANIHVFSRGAEDFFISLAEILFGPENNESSTGDEKLDSEPKGSWMECFPGIEKHYARYLITRCHFFQPHYKYLRDSSKDDFIKEKYSNILEYYSDITENEKQLIVDSLKKILFLYERLKIEIIIFIASVKGKFRGAVLLESPRIKRYYEAIQGLIDKLPKLKNANPPPKRPHGDLTIAHSIRSIFSEFLGGKLPENELGEEKFFWNQISPDDFAQTLLSYCKLENLPCDDQGNIIEAIKHIIDRMDITLVREAPRLIAFKKPNIICQFKDLAIITNDILENSGELSIISETGEWFANKLSRVKVKSLRMIVSNYRDDELNSFHYTRAERVFSEINDYIKDNKIESSGIILAQEKQPIDHHMTVGDKKAIYFYRHGRSIAVCPIYITDPDDVQTLKNIFQTYWDELQKDKKNK